jgi:uncharacterized repeat protein (TIGR01451 family)
MKNTNKFLIGFALTGSVLALAQPAHAQYGQYGSYGQYGTKGVQPGQNILIDKLVAESGSTKNGDANGIYKDNLLVSDTRFAPGETAVFKILVKNVSNVTLKNIVVKDIVPAYAEPTVGPGTYDKTSRIVTYTIAELKPNEENVQYLKLMIVSQNQLPANQGIIKLVNNVQVTAENASDSDTSQFFAEKKPMNITQVPKTGPALGLAFLALQGIGLAIGLKLRKVDKS